MKRLALGLLLATFSAAAVADGVLLGRDLVGKGDAAAQIRAVAGEPAQLDRIPGDEYSPAMEIWTYRVDGKVVNLWLVGDKVVKAAEERVANSGGSGTDRSPQAR
jgi:hypothetical protein